MKILSARYVLPISSPPIENGAVVVERDAIRAVGKIDEIVAQFPDAPRDDFGEAVLLPGFVNAHAHLEITAMRGYLDSVEHDFPAWLLKLNRTRAEILTDDDVKTAARFGALEAARAGVTCLGDIGRFGAAGFEALKANHLRGVIFQETEFTPDNRTADEAFEKLKEKFLQLKDTETDLVTVGISPHSPYTVSRRLFERIADYAIASDVKISTHAAESVQESVLLEKGEGFFIGLYEKFGFEWEIPFCSPVEFLEKTGILQTHPVLAHCVKVSDADIDLIKRNEAAVAHCPKSNAKFGHGAAPLEKFLDAHVNLGFGSDSVASNNSCDILEEARFAVLTARNLETKKRFIAPVEALHAATLGGAAALGLDRETGSLEAGKQADIIAVSLENAAQMPVHDAATALVFSSNARDVVMTMVAGTEIYRNDASKVIDETEIKAKMREIAERMRNFNG